jgi:hypothetical protein
MLSVTKGLIIDQPWIDLILSGRKTWEMRATGASHTGWFGLIRKGSGQVVGIAKIESVGKALSPDEMIATFDNHQIPESMIRSGAVAKWTRPWKLIDVTRLARPVPYHHPSGAVTWVKLDAAVSAAIASQFESADPDLVGSRSSTSPTAPRRANPAALRPEHKTPPPAVEVTPTGPSLIMGDCELTQGNLTHNHFYMRGFVHRFPGDLIGGSNVRSAASRSAIIDWGGATNVETDIDGDKKFFRKRGWIKQFFADNDAAPGDRVRVTQTAPYCYRVTLLKGAA